MHTQQEREEAKKLYAEGALPQEVEKPKISQEEIVKIKVCMKWI